MAKNSNKIDLLLLVLAVIAITFYFWPRADKPVPTRPDKLYDVYKTGAGIVVDFTRTAKNIHAVVDTAIKERHGFVISKLQEERKVPRTSVEGSIRWHARKIYLRLPEETTLDSFKKQLTGKLLPTKAKILSSSPEVYEGKAYIRLEIGVQDKLENDVVTIITDRLYIEDLSKEKTEKQVPPEKSKKDEVNDKKPKLAFIIDDFGYSQEPITKFVTLDCPITFAVLPYRPFTQLAADSAITAGKQVMIHLPMEPISRAAQSEEITIMADMAPEKIRSIVTLAMKEIPKAIGINNHQGSRATADATVMNEVLQVIKKHNMFFVDSHTHSSSLAFTMAKQMNVATGLNELFLDNQADVEYVKKQIRKGIIIAQNQNQLIAIGHARETTYQAIEQMLPEIHEAGIDIVFVSQLVK